MLFQVEPVGVVDGSVSLPVGTGLHLSAFVGSQVVATAHVEAAPGAVFSSCVAAALSGSDETASTCVLLASAWTLEVQASGNGGLQVTESARACSYYSSYQVH